MKNALLIFSLVAVAFAAACDVQSGITKNAVEKYGPTPTPSVMPTPVEEPIDPADVVQVDTSLNGPMIPVNESQQKKTVNCDKFNQVQVNGSDAEITVKGACSNITVNGNGNRIAMEAVSTITFNGNDNKVTYSRIANGKRPFVTDNKRTNTTEQASAPAKDKK